MSKDVRQEEVDNDRLVSNVASEFQDPKERKKAATSGDYVGMFEKDQMENGRALFQPMEVSPSFGNDVTYYQSFKTQYEIYKIPAHHAARSLGRVKDLVAVGAPRGPADIDAKTMKKFGKIDTIGEKDSNKSVAANQFAEQQEETQGSFEEYMLARESLQGALMEFRAGQRILTRRAHEYERAGKHSEKAKIDQAADTLMTITNVAMSATGYMAALEGVMSLDEEEYEETEVYDNDTGQNVQTSKVKKTSTAKKAMGIAKAAGGMLDLKGIFIWAMGDSAEYERLQREIAKLSQQIEDDKIATEDWTIASANEKLKNVKVSISGRQRAFSAKKGLARDAARNFGQAMGGGEKSILVSLMASAYQELDLFGTRALEEANQIWPAAKGVWGWLADHEGRYKVSDDFDTYKYDYETLGRAVTDVNKSRTTFQEEVPIWKQTALAWRHFLSDVMGTSFDKDDNPDTRAPVGTAEG